MAVHAALISSPSLRANSLVLGTVPTLGFDVAQFINKYQVRHYTDLDLSSWPHQMLSEGCEVMKVDLNYLPKKPLKVERKSTNLVLCFSSVIHVHFGALLQVERRVSVEVKTGGTAVGIAYWFTLHMYGDISISTYQPEVVSHYT